jgi:hypothetical protein
MANDCNEITLATGLDLEDGKAILGIVEGDALDGARQGLKSRFAILLRRSEHLVHFACREPRPFIVLVRWASSMTKYHTSTRVPILFCKTAGEFRETEPTPCRGRRIGAPPF